jgi:hypothetical protein
VVLQRLPLDHQSVALRLLDRAVQGECLESARAAEQRARLADACLELAFHPGRNVDLSNFGDHAPLPVSLARLLLFSARRGTRATADAVPCSLPSPFPAGNPEIK